MYKIFITAMFFIFSTSAAFAYGPTSIALSDRSLWPEKISDAEKFDRASLAEILVFTSVFNEKEIMGQDDLGKWLNLKSVNMISVKKWKEKTAAILFQNYKIAATSSPKDDFICSKSVKSFKDLSEMASGIGSRIPANYKSWYENSRTFHEAYIHEQYRLAALFPETTSEIGKLSEDEIAGSEIKDKHFLLTFDDGPSEQYGTTDKLIEMLNFDEAFCALGMVTILVKLGEDETKKTAEK